MKKQNKNSNPREFIKTTATVAAGVSLGSNVLASPIIQPVWGANDKIRVGFIGVGNRGSQLLSRFMANEDVEVAALCDVYEPFLLRDPARVHPRYKAMGRTPGMGEKLDQKVRRFADFRELLDQKVPPPF